MPRPIHRDINIAYAGLYSQLPRYPLRRFLEATRPSKSNELIPHLLQVGTIVPNLMDGHPMAVDTVPLKLHHLGCSIPSRHTCMTIEPARLHPSKASPALRRLRCLSYPDYNATTSQLDQTSFLNAVPSLVAITFTMYPTPLAIHARPSHANFTSSHPQI